MVMEEVSFFLLFIFACHAHEYIERKLLRSSAGTWACSCHAHAMRALPSLTERSEMFPGRSSATARFQEATHMMWMAPLARGNETPAVGPVLSTGPSHRISQIETLTRRPFFCTHVNLGFWSVPFAIGTSTLVAGKSCHEYSF